ncbi:hypothetical protein GUITHDRAFT_132888 [Guillardia theta CCMP2712]|uniref:Uncharacterized protein n=1 Tax=Guillardia theta (strain CCMP2712) TaxID=905079 RepID=L1JZY9_GUITC|nr:hypothetical protein GUITHDRAFT_132888 [Guillardia theta CCMP2712]EKX53849.1 hypothetical protein GUITHDRAFT_132888 [Guillardia theta CCMP2712]|eukprot:XP_005840829.1 hypothetical protein GUITHDRAFT_132888 [Guillardia theta CCMP2712]
MSPRGQQSMRGMQQQPRPQGMQQQGMQQQYPQGMPGMQQQGMQQQGMQQQYPQGMPGMQQQGMQQQGMQQQYPQGMPGMQQQGMQQQGMQQQYPQGMPGMQQQGMQQQGMQQQGMQQQGMQQQYAESASCKRTVTRPTSSIPGWSSYVPRAAAHVPKRAAHVSRRSSDVPGKASSVAQRTSRVAGLASDVSWAPTDISVPSDVRVAMIDLNEVGDVQGDILYAVNSNPQSPQSKLVVVQGMPLNQVISFLTGPPNTPVLLSILDGDFPYLPPKITQVMRTILPTGVRKTVTAKSPTSELENMGTMRTVNYQSYDRMPAMGVAH